MHDPRSRFGALLRFDGAPGTRSGRPAGREQAASQQTVLDRAQLQPTTPLPLFLAAMVPATCVPCP